MLQLKYREQQDQEKDGAVQLLEEQLATVEERFKAREVKGYPRVLLSVFCHGTDQTQALLLSTTNLADLCFIAFALHTVPCLSIVYSVEFVILVAAVVLSKCWNLA